MEGRVRIAPVDEYAIQGAECRCLKVPQAVARNDRFAFQVRDHHPRPRFQLTDIAEVAGRVGVQPGVGIFEANPAEQLHQFVQLVDDGRVGQDPCPVRAAVVDSARCPMDVVQRVEPGAVGVAAHGLEPALPLLRGQDTRMREQGNRRDPGAACRPHRQEHPISRVPQIRTSSKSMSDWSRSPSNSHPPSSMTTGTSVHTRLTS